MNAPNKWFSSSRKGRARSSNGRSNRSTETGSSIRGFHAVNGDGVLSTIQLNHQRLGLMGKNTMRTGIWSLEWLTVSINADVNMSACGEVSTDKRDRSGLKASVNLSWSDRRHRVPKTRNILSSRHPVVVGSGSEEVAWETER
eukprot:scpid33654/ scgid23801/ 